MVEWRPIPSAPGYEASGEGLIRRVAASSRGRKPGVLKGGPTKRRRQVDIFDGAGGFKRRGLHVLVCEAFHGPAPQGKPLVRHLDDDCNNNRPSNLAWGDFFDNAADRKRNGRYARGPAHCNAVLTEEQQRCLVARKAAGARSVALATEFGIHFTTVDRIYKRWLMMIGASAWSAARRQLGTR